MKCFACQDEMKLVWHDIDPSTGQFHEALILTFEGGYGMFIDTMEAPYPKIVICGKCANELCRVIPWIGKMLEEYR